MQIGWDPIDELDSEKDNPLPAWGVIALLVFAVLATLSILLR